MTSQTFVTECTDCIGFAKLYAIALSARLQHFGKDDLRYQYVSRTMTEQVDEITVLDMPRSWKAAIATPIFIGAIRELLSDGRLAEHLPTYVSSSLKYAA